jgi:hypothetical protein
MPFFNMRSFNFNTRFFNKLRSLNKPFFSNLLGLLLTLGAGYIMYQRDVADGSIGDPPAAIDTTPVRERLMNIGKAEWEFNAEHGTYATLEELASNDQLYGGPVQYGYHFVATANATSFLITATPVDEDMAGWPTLEIDETLRIIEK